MRHTYRKIGGREYHARVWGDKKAPWTVVAWHGISRNGSDFCALAESLAGRYRIICPDALGRGLSQWAKNPDAEYRIGPMVRQAVALLEDLKVRRCLWVGTSMGGLIGMGAALGPFGRRIGGMVLNDIAPEIPSGAAGYILEYLSAGNSFDTLADAERSFRESYAQFGPLSNREWRDLTARSVARRADGKWTAMHDPRVGAALSDPPPDPEPAWRAFAQIPCPLLVLRGEHSDILTPELAERMRREHPRCRVKTVEGCGHAPFLNTGQQIRAVSRFLRRCER